MGSSCCFVGLLAWVALMATAQSAGAQQVMEVFAGDHHTLALLTDGTVKAWGRNHRGQLGLGDTIDRNTPQLIPGLATVVKLAAGEDFSLALLSDGTVKSWGSGDYGQLGLGSTQQHATPQLIPSLANIGSIAAGVHHAFAIEGGTGVWLYGGPVKSWGRNTEFQLGLGSGNTANQSTPTLIPGLSGVTTLKAGETHSLARLTDGTVKSWGKGLKGQLGQPSTGVLQMGGGFNVWFQTQYTYESPTLISGLVQVSSIAAGRTSSFAVLNNGTANSWGGGEFGQLGLATTNADQISPTAMPTLTNVYRIEAKGLHALAIMNDTTVKLWGHGAFGQLGLGNTTSFNTPQIITGLYGIGSWQSDNITVGGFHTLALGQGGRLYVWGYNDFGNLGLGHNTSMPSPTINCLVYNNTAYGLALLQTSNTLGVEMTCGGSAASSKLYFNVFAPNFQAAPYGPGVMGWYGMGVETGLLLQHLDLALSGFTPVFGQLDFSGNRTEWLVMPTALLYGVTLYANSIVIDPLLNSVVLTAPVISHTF